MNCGERLKALREQKGFTQRELAAQVDMYFTSISKIENGERKLTLEEAVRVSEVLGVDLKEIAGLETAYKEDVSFLTRETAKGYLTALRIIVTDLETKIYA